MILRPTHWLFFVLLISTQFCLRAVTANAQTFRTDEPRHTPLAIDAKAIESSLDPFIAEEMKKQHLPGLVFVLVKDGRVVLSKGYGWANLEQKIPATPERTIFRIGSITKVFTAMALMQLADRRKLDLHDDVNRFLDRPGVDQKYDQPVRVRHLLTHTAGFDQTGLGRRVEKPEERKSLAEFVGAQLIRIRPPGQVSCYDTYGITLAGYLVERISGLSYASYLKQNVFKPLGMQRTNVETPDALKHDLAIGYGYRDGKYVPQPYEYYVTLPASSIDATALDMARWMIALLGDGSTKSARFLSPTTARRIKQPQFTNYPGFPGFAYGFWEDLRNGQRAIHHGGDMLGFTTEMYLLPKHDLGFFVAYNRNQEAGGGPATLRDLLTEKLMNHWFAQKEPEKKQSPVVPLKIDTRVFEGKYANNLYCHTCFDGQGWGWRLTDLRSGGPGVLIGSRRWLAIGPLLFQEENGSQRIAFRTGKSGEITHLIVGNTVHEKLGERLLEEVLGPGWKQRPVEPLTARVYRDTEQWQKAALAYTAITERRPSDGRAHYYLGFCWLNAGEPERALASFARARELKQWPAFTAYYKAAALARKGDKKDAIDALEEALKLGFSDNELLQRDTHLDGLRKEPRFKALLNGDPKAITQEPSRYRSEDVRYQNEKIGLAALLLLPESDKRVPGAVILQGSGASDRTNQWARAISDELMRKGIAVLLTDKRGSGKSEGNWQTSDFSELAGDAIAGVEYLRQRREIDPDRVGLVGLSQGGWVAPLAAAKSEQVAFVITVSAASVSFAEQTFTEMANTARQAGLPEKHIREVLELNRAAAAYATTGNWANYMKLREEALKSPWSKIAAGFPGSPDLPVWTFLRGVGAYDPIPYWIQVTEPTLVLYGEKDEHDNVPVAESVRRLKHAFEIVGKENYRIVVIPNAGHSFIDTQQKQLVPEFVKALTSWVEEFVVR